MLKRYRAYDESADIWIYFKLVYDETGWELHSPHFRTGDKVDDSDENNLHAALNQLYAYANEHKLTKITELSGSDL